VHPSVIIGASIAYVLLLFAIASFGDRKSVSGKQNQPKPLIYALSIAIYCTSWTFFGSVGLAAERGYEFLGIYIGPILVFLFGHALLRKIVRLSKSERITSIADFLAARYGKSFAVASLATIIATIGAIPYIALQLKAIAGSFDLFVEHYGYSTFGSEFVITDFSFLIAMALGLFAVLFGTRHADATEHQNGLILAVAIESVVKLSAFLVAGVAVTFFLFGTPAGLLANIAASDAAQTAIQHPTSIATWLTYIGLSAAAIIMLPRQFHVMIVENRDVSELKTANWLFPLYLIAINLFVLPIALIGVAVLGAEAPNDFYVLALPLAADADWISLFVFIGGLSAATAMVIVASVALSIMISNDLVLPVMLRRYVRRERAAGEDLPATILNVRRAAIFCIMLAAYTYFRATETNFRLASVGLISFAAIAQFAPAFFFGLIWRGANARGAVLGMGAGILVWFYTLFLPTLLGPDADLVQSGLLGIAALRPRALFGLEAAPLIHGVVWSLLFNVSLYVLGSLSRQSHPLERIQAAIFVPREIAPMPNLRRLRTQVTLDDLKSTIARYVGEERTERSFASHEKKEGRSFSGSAAADMAAIRFSEQLLASAVGSSSSRLIMSLLIQRNDKSSIHAARLLDDASEALQQNRDLLQIALNQMEQGITVFDRDFRLTCWNRQFRTLFDLPDEFGQVGVPLSDVLTHLKERGQISAADENAVFNQIIDHGQPWTVELTKHKRIIEFRSNPMPDGGLVTTYSDITDRVASEGEMKKLNESLEQRVSERTVELSMVNEELGRARWLAEEANIGKTRFLAAAGHDILQPLNAARLYSSSLSEKLGKSENEAIVGNIESSLDAVETILGAVLDISRLDTGALKPAVSNFALVDLLKQIETDFCPLAKAKGIKLRVAQSPLQLNTDRNLMRRLVQNLVSNAVKYTPSGGVVVGVRRWSGGFKLVVVDTGIGIASDKKQLVFQEFTRLDEGAREADGLGLGLSIVDRISKVLGLPVELGSRRGRGTEASVDISSIITSKVDKISTPQVDGRIEGTLNHLHVLCVDNDKRILGGMHTLLEGWGCKVRCIERADEAIALANRPHVVLADYHLEKGNGIEMIEALRKRFGENMPAILITADRSNEVRDEAIKNNIVFLNKPVKPAALRAALQSQQTHSVAAE
jgi:Na+/proline symporter/signal transduction histidine kinase/ActR/RegA family two-component response regulator